ncbi:hypothetical protein PSI23_15165 [Xenorhabdus sp. XENO-10]|uniref:Uncharacterized protein n=1 Tax=Xenorhabdus yunnanensis TaxID=3025878 RepID=A0ABT5LHK3_9GAMM|nr:hypothetical protein [Xenorhabdus yunnanensis]MDC9590590.1 hypothetical protein [Xenorhabdus yunnanensis]
MSFELSRVNSQLAGQLNKNHNLNSAARIIVNEVVGNKANVVISNQNGDLHSVNVSKGQITIGEKGLNGDGINGVALVSRFLEVNGQIKANDISIKAGGDETDYNKPRFAIDTKALGSMYASKIFVQSTENGFGINLSNLVSTEILTVSSSGPVNLSGTIKSGNSLMVMAPVINQASNTKIEAGNGFPMLINMNPYDTILN